LYFLGLNFQNFFLNFFANCPRLTNTVKGCRKVVSFYSGKLSNVLYKRKKSLSSSFLVQLPEQILIFRPEPSRHSPALELKLKNLSYIHSLNKTKQPFYNLLQCFRVKDNLRKNSKKNLKI
jgi:hypothetical protein